MFVTANTAGGHSTLDVLIGVAVLMWALAGAAVLFGWVWRFARKRRAGHRYRWASRNGGWLGARRNPLRATAARAGASPAGAHAGVGGPSAEPASDAGPGAGAPPPGASAPAEPPTAPAIPGARLSPEQLEPVGQHLDTSRRLAASETRVARALAALPADRWFVERYVLFAGHRIPFLIFGETGVFALWAIPGPPQWREVPYLDNIARQVENALPGYAGTVQVGICRAGNPDIKPRWWCRPGEPGAWVIGLDWLTRWIEHFEPQNGLGVKDLQRLRELAGPRWGRPATDVPLSAHIPTID
jgi:hypothetical protein